MSNIIPDILTTISQYSNWKDTFNPHLLSIDINKIFQYCEIDKLTLIKGPFITKKI